MSVAKVSHLTLESSGNLRKGKVVYVLIAECYWAMCLDSTAILCLIAIGIASLSRPVIVQTWALTKPQIRSKGRGQVKVAMGLFIDQ